MVTLIILIVLFIILYKFLTINNDYWAKQGVPYIKPLPFFGNLFNVFIRGVPFQTELTKWYEESEGHRFIGVFNLSKPTLLLRDTTIITSILKSDFSRFSAKGFQLNHKVDPLSVNVFFMDGPIWKRSRQLLRAGFKSGRLRALVPLVEKAAKEVFGKGLEKNCMEIIEMKKMSKRFAAAVIMGPILGLELDEATLNVFVHHCDQSFSTKGWRAVPVFVRLFLPKIAFALGMKGVLQETEDFFVDLVKELKLARKEGGPKEDYFDTIMSATNILAENKNLSEEFLNASICGQLFVFVLGGFETTATTLTYALHELAHHFIICEEAREEIERVMDGKRENFTYDHLKEMKYLDNVINEVLRLHPPVGGFMRVCTAPYKIPNTDIILQPGDSLQIPVLPIHKDPKYFENPEEFYPSRFSESIVEGSFIPFADGPRNCIGMRLAMMELKTVLAFIIANFDISPDPLTPEELEIDSKHLITTPLSNVWIRLTPISIRK